MANPLTTNAADKRAVRDAGRLERRFAEARRERLLGALNTPEGRGAIYDVLEDCGIYRSVFLQDSHATAYQAGKQDVGHQLQARILEADDRLYELMEREARARKRQASDTIDAVTTTASEPGESV